MTATCTVTIVLALATLGDVTEIGFLNAWHKVAKASTVVPPKVTVTCRCGLFWGTIIFGFQTF